jgi:hypothetical protein
VYSNGRITVPKPPRLGRVNPGIAAFADGRVIAQHGDYSLISAHQPARRRPCRRWPE